MNQTVKLSELWRCALSLFACGVAIVFVSVWCPLHFGRDSMPQATDTDPLSIVFGDVRTIISHKMIMKSDQYLHGGVTEPIDCVTHGHLHEHLPNDNDGDEDHDVSEHDADKEAPHPIFNPWGFVSSRIRLPDVDRHLDGEASRELLPWLWAAIRVSTDNINAYADTAYVLEVMYGQPEKAVEVLKMGIKANPSNPELEFQLGDIQLHELKNDTASEEAFLRALNKVRKLDDEDAILLRLRTLSYLGALAARRNDANAVKAFYNEANGLMPNHAATISLKRLTESESLSDTNDTTTRK